SLRGPAGVPVRLFLGRELAPAAPLAAALALGVALGHPLFTLGHPLFPALFAPLLALGTPGPAGPAPVVVTTVPLLGLPFLPVVPVVTHAFHSAGTHGPEQELEWIRSRSAVDCNSRHRWSPWSKAHALRILLPRAPAGGSLPPPVGSAGDRLHGSSRA